MTNPKRTAAGRFFQVTSLALLVALAACGLAGRQSADAAATAKPAATPKPKKATGQKGANKVKSGGVSSAGTGSDDNTSASNEGADRLLRRINVAITKADDSGASKYEQTRERFSKLKERANSFKATIPSLSGEELEEYLSEPGEPAGEAKEIIGEANKITDEATQLGRVAGGQGDDNKGAEPEPDIDWGHLLGLLVRGLVGLLAVGALAAFIFFLVKLNRRVGELERRHNKVVQKLTVFEKALGEQDVFAQSVNSGLVRMREDVSREMEELRRSYRDMRGGQRAPAAAAAAVELFPQVEREPAPDPGPSFPALVSDYLSRVSDSKKVEVISDFRTHLFVPESGGPFVLVQDEDGTGSGIVLPKARLQRGQEFAHYRGTYYCDSPSAGDVFVVEPAVVERADGGWRLRRPGRLELK